GETARNDKARGPMPLDVVALRSFYDSPLGHAVEGIVAARLKDMARDTADDCAVGLGFAAPFMARFAGRARTAVSLMPARMGICAWPPEGANRAALVNEDELPLPDASVSRLLVVHALEEAETPEAVLREIWRVLAPGGRLVAVVPNRRGLWARADSTPFGNGRPYSRGQLDQLLAGAKLAPTGWSEALFMPPLRARPVVRAAKVLESIGRRVSPAFAGLIVVEAEKRLWQPVASDGRALRVPRLVPAMAGAHPVARFARRRRPAASAALERHETPGCTAPPDKA
ncbi:methyltransferase domain-containing protein, partial [Pseudoxanthobacter sp.]|uniref:class I SAM-dependent methyltransferase n=1 Tax=Pseudoxanthobacter sp. TaxID=1925742 RepID=UPI002FDFE100